LHLDITLTYCEFLESCLGFDTVQSWDAVFDLVCDGVYAQWSRNIILRTLWKERRASICRAHNAFTTAECIMLRQGVPRDVRHLICRRAGAYSKTTWMHWSRRLASLFVLWGQRQKAIEACYAARWTFGDCVKKLCSKRYGTTEYYPCYQKIMQIIEDVTQKNTDLYSLSAWLHWVDTGSPFQVVGNICEGD
jgi:hypothetical protein